MKPITSRANKFVLCSFLLSFQHIIMIDDEMGNPKGAKSRAGGQRPSEETLLARQKHASAELATKVLVHVLWLL
jgi:hypothetical protein